MRIVILLIAACGIMHAVYCQNTATEKRYIEVIGHHEEKVVPDEIHLSIRVVEERNKERLSLDQRSQLMIDGLKSVGIPSGNAFTLQIDTELPNSMPATCVKPFRTGNERLSKAEVSGT